ncbi:DUF3341 domain-containing protein [Rhizobium sp. P40RR-XXII]|uniref:DUF3341 domain-containing protein n=1 Tax=Rhizobium sp. P40RR-XXII TaxID=2726739 RepID=UPI0014569856|nr:DUF3341 domain-containing protein [Rhizobium sp. P40RR-XXII]NLS17666.1 DUF3341 domain-containing protein [Rhizobium sp. P40RR-XXII]
MREPRPGSVTFGLLAEFDRPDRLVEAANRARKAGFRAMEAYSPYPVHELTEALGFEENIVPWLTVAGGAAGAAVGYGLQLYTNYAYPIEIGGRPLFAWQSFVLITFELTVLFAVLAAIFGMLLLNRLPRLHHPLFDIESFHLASSDKFFLVIFSNDGRYHPKRTRAFLTSLKPVRVEAVEHTEQPE